MNRASCTKTTIVVGLVLVIAAATSISAKDRELTREFPAKEINAIILAGGNGSARIVVGDEDMVRIRVEIAPENWSDNKPWRGIKNWFLSSAYDDVDDLIEAVRLSADASPRGEIKIGLTPSRRARESKLREDWTITVPKRLAVELDMARATVEIKDVEGGVEASLGKGSLDVDVPRGDLDISVLVGKARVRTGSESVGKLGVRSQVGNTRVWMNGMKMKYPKPPGPGSHFSLSGKGQDSIRVSVQVGDASLRVDP